MRPPACCTCQLTASPSHTLPLAAGAVVVGTIDHSKLQGWPAEDLLALLQQAAAAPECASLNGLTLAAEVEAAAAAGLLPPIVATDETLAGIWHEFDTSDEAAARQAAAAAGAVAGSSAQHAGAAALRRRQQQPGEDEGPSGAAKPSAAGAGSSGAALQASPDGIITWRPLLWFKFHSAEEAGAFLHHNRALIEQHGSQATVRHRGPPPTWRGHVAAPTMEQATAAAVESLHRSLVDARQAALAASLAQAVLHAPAPAGQQHAQAAAAPQQRAQAAAAPQQQMLAPQQVQPQQPQAQQQQQPSPGLPLPPEMLGLPMFWAQAANGYLQAALAGPAAAAPPPAAAASMAGMGPALVGHALDDQGSEGSGGLGLDDVGDDDDLTGGPMQAWRRGREWGLSREAHHTSCAAPLIRRPAARPRLLAHADGGSGSDEDEGGEAGHPWLANWVNDEFGADLQQVG